jgi:hypothetical protein
VGREVIADWLEGRLARTEAIELAGVSEREFALAAYVATHDPIPEACEAVEGELAPEDAPSVEKRERLDATMSDADEFR